MYKSTPFLYRLARFFHIYLSYHTALLAWSSPSPLIYYLPCPRYHNQNPVWAQYIPGTRYIFLCVCEFLYQAHSKQRASRRHVLVVHGTAFFFKKKRTAIPGTSILIAINSLPVPGIIYPFTLRAYERIRTYTHHSSINHSTAVTYIVVQSMEKHGRGWPGGCESRTQVYGTINSGMYLLRTSTRPGYIVRSNTGAGVLLFRPIACVPFHFFCSFWGTRMILLYLNEE